MNADQALTRALAACPYPGTQIPVEGKGPIYVSFTEVSGRPTMYASNKPRTVEHMMQVDIWSRMPISPEVMVVVKALWAGGIMVVDWGPQMYEDDTGWHHMPITCRYNERLEE